MHGYFEVSGILWVTVEMTNTLALQNHFVTLRWGSGFNSTGCMGTAEEPTLPLGNFHIQYHTVVSKDSHSDLETLLSQPQVDMLSSTIQQTEQTRLTGFS